MKTVTLDELNVVIDSMKHDIEIGNYSNYENLIGELYYLEELRDRILFDEKYEMEEY